MLSDKELDEIEAWNAGGNYSGRPTEIKRDVAALVDEVRRLRSALKKIEQRADTIPKHEARWEMHIMARQALGLPNACRDMLS